MEFDLLVSPVLISLDMTSTNELNDVLFVQIEREAIGITHNPTLADTRIKLDLVHEV
jgi:hypothetical protein